MERRKFIERMGGTVPFVLAAPLLVGSRRGKDLGQTRPIEKLDIPDYPEKIKNLVKKACGIDMLGTFQDWFHTREGIPLGRYWLQNPDVFTAADHNFVSSCGIDVFGWGSMKPDYESMLSFMAEQNGLIASNPEYFIRIDTKNRLATVNGSGKIGMLITNQNSEHFRTLDDVDFFYGLGQRVSQLTYNGKNRLGCGAFEDKDTGITRFGEEVVARMNQVGMGVDVSHCGDKTTLDGIEASSRPVLITHGACRAMAPGVARTKTDEAIKAMAATGGVIGIPVLRFMIREKEPVDFDHFLAHIDHVTQLVGIDYVGIGSDQGLYTEDYGELAWRKERLTKAPGKYQVHTNAEYMLTIEKLNHPHRTYDIAEGLLKKGYSDTDVMKVLGNNFKRVLSEIFID